MADQGRHHVAIEMEAMLANSPPISKGECCIYRVPPSLRELKPNVYTPKVVSIGPFHHGNIQLLEMEAHKKMYCQIFIDQRSKANLDDLVKCIQELEPKVRRCYSENINLGEDELVKVLLVDCCFVLEFLMREFDGFEHSMPWLMKDIFWDLILLENQLPFFVFEKVYNLSFALNRGQHPSFIFLASGWFYSWFSFNRKRHPELQSTHSIVHFTDLYRYFFLQSFDTLPVTSEEILTDLYSATELHEAGVKFRANEGKCSLDLQFKGGCIEIPPFFVSDHTEIELRNVIVFEQCHYLEESHITYHIQFLNFLINTKNDVDLLVKKGILHNFLGDNKEVAIMFNDICKNIMISGYNSSYLRISKELKAYHAHFCHSKMATLRRDYCNTPWRTVASIAAILLLILTIIQTICSILQVPQ